MRWSFIQRVRRAVSAPKYKTKGESRSRRCAGFLFGQLQRPETERTRKSGLGSQNVACAGQKATCGFAPSDGRKAARARPCRRACAIAPRRAVHGSNSGRRPTSRSRDPQCEHVPEHEVFLTVMYKCSVEPSVPAYLSCSGHSPEHVSAIFDVQAFI